MISLLIEYKGDPYRTIDDSHKNTDRCSNPAQMDSAQSKNADNQCREKSGSGPSVQTMMPQCYAQARRPISANPFNSLDTR